MSSKASVLHTYMFYPVMGKGTLYIHALAQHIVSQLKSIISLADAGVDPINELLELKMLLLSIASNTKYYKYIEGLASELYSAISRDFIKALRIIGRSYLTQVLIKAFKALQGGHLEELKDAAIDIATILDLNFEKAPIATEILSRGSIHEVSSLLAMLIALGIKIERRL